MSYARFSDNSDVYVFSHVGGYVQCCGCILGDEWNFDSVEAIVAHMQRHSDAGHSVYDDLLDPATYADETFIAMCSVFMCREDEGHDGDHTPLSNEQWQKVREHSLATAVSTSREEP